MTLRPTSDQPIVKPFQVMAILASENEPLVYDPKDAKGYFQNLPPSILQNRKEFPQFFQQIAKDDLRDPMTSTAHGIAYIKSTENFIRRRVGDEEFDQASAEDQATALSFAYWYRPAFTQILQKNGGTLKGFHNTAQSFDQFFQGPPNFAETGKSRIDRLNRFYNGALTSNFENLAPFIEPLNFFTNQEFSSFLKDYTGLDIPPVGFTRPKSLPQSVGETPEAIQTEVTQAEQQHQTLVDVFQSLPPEQQQTILNDPKLARELLSLEKEQLQQLLPSLPGTAESEEIVEDLLGDALATFVPGLAVTKGLLSAIRTSLGKRKTEKIVEAAKTVKPNLLTEPVQDQFKQINETVMSRMIKETSDVQIQAKARALLRAEQVTIEDIKQLSPEFIKQYVELSGPLLNELMRARLVGLDLQLDVFKAAPSPELANAIKDNLLAMGFIQGQREITGQQTGLLLRGFRDDPAPESLKAVLRGEAGNLSAEDLAKLLVAQKEAGVKLEDFAIHAKRPGFWENTATYMTHQMLANPRSAMNALTASNAIYGFELLNKLTTSLVTKEVGTPESIAAIRGWIGGWLDLAKLGSANAISKFPLLRSLRELPSVTSVRRDLLRIRSQHKNRFQMNAKAEVLDSMRENFTNDLTKYLNYALTFGTRLIKGADDLTRYAIERSHLVEAAKQYGVPESKVMDAPDLYPLTHPFTGEALNYLKISDDVGDVVTLMRPIESIINTKHPLIKIIAPFLNVRIRSLEEAIKLVPGLAQFSPDVKKALEAGGAPAALAKGRMALGMLLLTAGGVASAGGVMTGSRPVDPKLAALWDASGRREKSFLVADRTGLLGEVGKQYTIPFRLLQPYSDVFTAISDIATNAQFIKNPSDLQEIVAPFTMMLAQKLSDNIFYDDLMNIFGELGTGEFGPATAEFLTRFYPASNLFASFERAMREGPPAKSRDTKLEAFTQFLKESMKVKGLPGESLFGGDMAIRADWNGDDVYAPPGWISNVVFPFYPVPVEPNPVKKAVTDEFLRLGFDPNEETIFAPFGIKVPIELQMMALRIRKQPPGMRPLLDELSDLMTTRAYQDLPEIDNLPPHPLSSRGITKQDRLRLIIRRYNQATKLAMNDFFAGKLESHRLALQQYLLNPQTEDNPNGIELPDLSFTEEERDFAAQFQGFQVGGQ